MTETWFCKPGFRVLVDERADSKHFQGGEPTHRGANCTICDRRLLLLWTIDTRDPRIERIATTRGSNDAAELRRFRKLGPLPIYYCWRCCCDLSYRVVSSKTVKILQQEGEPQDDDFPYADYPSSFPRLPLRLDVVPFEIDAMLRAASVERHWHREEDECVVLARACGFDKSEYWRVGSVAQIGGLPPLVRGFEHLDCLNPKCEDGGYGDESLRVFATIHETLELPMLKTDTRVQVIAYICTSCHALRVINRCD